MNDAAADSRPSSSASGVYTCMWMHIISPFTKQVQHLFKVGLRNILKITLQCDQHYLLTFIGGQLLAPQTRLKCILGSSGSTT